MQCELHEFDSGSDCKNKIGDDDVSYQLTYIPDSKKGTASQAGDLSGYTDTVTLCENCGSEFSQYYPEISIVDEINEVDEVILE